MSGVLTQVAGRRRTGGLVTGISRLLALACLVGLVGMLPWLSGKDPALTILRATSSDREPTPEVLASIRQSIGIDGGPLHVIGHWLVGVARGDLQHYGEVIVPFDHALRHSDIAISTVPVVRNEGGPLIEESYIVDENGMVTVEIKDLEADCTVTRPLGRR